MTRGQLLGRTAVITGGSSGIGRAIALRYADEGATVVVTSRDLARCDEIRREIVAKGQKALAIACDVTDEQQVSKLFAHTNEMLGKIDIVVASAGISGGSKRVEEYELADWNRVLATNLTGVFLTAREAFRYMKTHGGHIIVISSQAGVEAYAGKGAYCASKFGARGLAQALGEEGRKHSINVSSICPGTVDTPILAATNTRVKNPMAPDAVADAAVYLAALRGNALVRDLLVERMNLG